jgi:hypothetical protein
MRTDLLLYGPGRLSPGKARVATVAYGLGGVLLVWSAYIHFHLWHSVGYHSIPTIGDLFIVQSIAGLLVGLLVVALRRVWVAIVGVGFALSTMGGFLLCVVLPKGLFNFKESWLAPFAKEAFTIEIAIIVVLLIAAALCLAGSASATRAGFSPAGSPSPGA